MFTDTFAGIAPFDVPAFVVAQIVGGFIGLVLYRALKSDYD
jgi:glycerol uptake facilitator-like aquaporin